MTLPAEDNDEDGVYLDNCTYDATSGTCLGNGIVSISGNSVNSLVNDNGGTGLYILSGSNVTLMNFTADGNNYGVYIKNDYIGKSGAVTIKQTYTSDLEDFTNSVSNNTLNGIQIYSNGNISIQDLIIANNGGIGAIMNNSTGKAKSVSLRAVDAYTNGGDGLRGEHKRRGYFIQCEFLLQRSQWTIHSCRRIKQDHQFHRRAFIYRELHG